MRSNVTHRLAVALVAMIVLGGWCSGQARADDPVLVKVDGKEITESQLKLAESEIGPELARYSEADRRQILVNYLIENQLFANSGEKESLGSGPDFESRLAYYKLKAVRDAYVDKAIRNAVTDDEAKAIYDQQIKSVQPKEEVHARHILVEKEDDAKAILDQIKGGADFAKIAQEKSIDKGSGVNGGDLGFFSKGQMVKEFEDAAFALTKPGDLSGVVKTQFGFHIIKLEEKRSKPLPTFEMVKDKIRGSLVQQKYGQVITTLRNAAKIEYVDAALKKAADDAAAQGALPGAATGGNATEGQSGQ